LQRYLKRQSDYTEVKRVLDKAAGEILTQLHDDNTEGRGASGPDTTDNANDG